MKPPINPHRPDGGIVLDDRFEDLFDEIPTPEELHRAEAELEAFAKFSKERPALDDKDRGEKEKEALAKLHETLAALDARYEKEKSEKEKKG